MPGPAETPGGSFKITGATDGATDGAWLHPQGVAWGLMMGFLWGPKGSIGGSLYFYCTFIVSHGIYL